MTEATAENLSKDALKKIVICAFIMSGIDGYMDDSEFEVISDFTDRNWTDSFGDKESFFKEVDHEVLEFFVPATGRFELSNDNINDIVRGLNRKEEQLMLDLMNRVMEADGILDQSEVSLMKQIKSHLENRPGR